ncbi:MAG: MlaD family protein [candidate division WOR-3 bacterium]|nr:MlaD family protein [candidate division WOR-3 bacterium]
MATSLIIISYLGFSGKLKKIKGYEVIVYFKDVSGLKVGAPVMVRGIEKGRVLEVTLNSTSQFVTVKLLVNSDVILTEDSYFAIRALSYFGTDKFVNITPGTGKAVERKSPINFYGTNETLELENVLIQLKSIISKFENIPVDSIKEYFLTFRSNADSLIKIISFPMIKTAEEFIKLSIKFDSLSKFLTQEGTISKLIKSDELYEEIRRTNNELSKLLADIKRNPQKYFTIKIF